MSDKSKAAWAAILAKKRAQQPENPDTPVVAGPVVKRGSTCGNPACCMGQPRDRVTYEGPSVLGPGGMDMGGYSFKGIEPPMLCSGVNWMPRELTRWEKQKQAAKAAPGLADFKKK